MGMQLFGIGNFLMGIVIVWVLSMFYLHFLGLWEWLWIYYQTKGINDLFKNKVILMNVDMSKGCGGGLPKVIEIVGITEVRILTLKALYQDT